MVTEPIIDQSSAGKFLQEANGVAWLGTTGLFVTAKEGELRGGSRVLWAYYVIYTT